MLLINDGFIRTPGVLSIVSCHLTAIGGLVERENDRPGRLSVLLNCLE